MSRIQILVAALLFSTGGAAIKACSFNSWQVASFRSGVAAIAVFILVPAARRFWQPRALLVGAAYAACLTLFVSANKTTTAANTIFLQSTAPLYMLLLSPWLLREPIRLRDLGFMAALGVGMITLFLGTDVPTASAPDPALGNVLATLSGIGWALTMIGLRWLGRSQRAGATPAGAAVIAGNLIAFLWSLPFALPVEGGGTAADWLVVAYLGVFQIGLAYLSLTAALRKVPALDTALLLLLEPVLNPLWAWLVQGETPGPWSFVGATIILAGTILKAMRP